MTCRPLLRYEYPVLAVGLALMVLHTADEGFVSHEPLGALSFAMTVAFGAIVLALYARLGLWWRVGICVSLGALTVLAAIPGHVVHFFQGTAAGGDYSGLGYAVGGAMLLGLGLVVVARRHRLGVVAG